MIKEIVIAGYDKDTSWTEDLKDIKVTIYRKGNIKINEGDIKIEPNIGRDVHTFFYHIYNNYDTLSDYTFFVQDYPFDHWENLIELINNNTFIQKCTLNIDDGYFGYHNNTIGMPNRNNKYNYGGGMWNLSDSTQVGNGKILRCYSNGLPQDYNPNINVEKYWIELFETEIPSVYEFIPGAHFCLEKNHAKVRNKSFYKKIIEILENDTSAPWIIERLECYIFNKKFISKI